MTMLQEPEGISVQEERPVLLPGPTLPEKESVNAVTHGIGLVLSIVGAIVLIDRSVTQGDAYRVAGCAVFAVTMIAVYAASTLSHTTWRPELRPLFRRLDQGSIYLLIVGTCMPWALAYLRTEGWFAFFGLMWFVALCGLVSKILFSHRVEAVAVWSYVLLGWMPIFAVPPLVNIVPAPALWGMVIGGVFYTSGTLFLMNDHRHSLLHAVWHVFVILGSTCHFITIFVFVAGLPTGA